MAQIVHVDGLARNRGVTRVVGLVENIRIQLLLLLTVGVNSGRSSIDRLGHACFSLPIGGRAHDVALGITVVVRLFPVKIATTKDCRLQVLVLLASGVDIAISVIAVLHW